MNITSKLITVAVMLVHSIFGCSVHHACACESHEHGEHQHVADVEQAGLGDHDLDHRDAACGHSHEHDGDQAIVEFMLVTGCDCCETPSRDHGDSPCCSEVQCSFILGNDVEFSLDVGPVPFVLFDLGCSLVESPDAKCFVESSRLRSGIDDPLSQCALHCSWQI